MFFYYDSTGQRQGPITQQELKDLANQGIITPETPLEMDGGRKGKAGQVKGLFPKPTKPEEYFYYDSQTAERKGPYSKLELENFYGSGIITDDTIIEDQAGRTTEWKNIAPPRRHDGDTFAPIPTPIPIPPKPDDDDIGFTPARVGGFLDITFTRFITNWVIPIIWCISLVLAIGAVFVNPILLFFIIEAIFNGAPFIDDGKLFMNAIAFAFVLFVLQIPILLWGLLNVRIFLEAIMVFFRMEKHLRKLSGDN